MFEGERLTTGDWWATYGSVQLLMVALLGFLWWLPRDGKTQVTIEHVTDAYKNGGQVLRMVLEEFILKNGQMVMSLYGDCTHLYIELSGSSSLQVLREMMA